MSHHRSHHLVITKEKIMSHHRSHRVTLPLIAIASIGVLALAGCSTTEAGPTEAGPSEGSDDKVRIAMVTPASTDPFYGAMYCGAQAAAAEQEIDLTIQGSPEVTVEAEMQVLQTVLATEPDGMVLTVWDQQAFNTTMKPYTDSGRPLVMADSSLGSGEYLQSIRTDSYQSSYDAAVKVVESFGLSSGKVLILTDSPGNGIQVARAEGFTDAIEAETEIEVLELQYISNDSAKASNAVTSASAGNDDLVMVFSTNIPAGTGAANGISTAGKDIVHVGYDTSSTQVDQLRNGDYDVLVAQSPYQTGYDSVTLVAEILNGDKKVDDVKEETMFSPTALVTRDNVDEPDIAAFIYTSDCN